MKRSFLLLCTVLLVLGCALPLGTYRLTRAAAHRTGGIASSAIPDPAESAVPSPSDGFADDSTEFLLADESTGELLRLSRREYLIGAVAAEMPVSWADEALKAQAVAAHSYALYCRDHTTRADGAWLTVDPARRQGCLTDPVLRSYWGTAYEANYALLSALVEQVETQVLCYGGAPAGSSYFALSNGQTESSEAVWGAALPYLVSVDSSTDRSADNYEYTVTFSTGQLQSLLSAGLSVSADPAAPEQWFGAQTLTAAGYTASLSVCGQTVSGTALRRALGLRSTCFSVSYQDGSFRFTTRGYGHGVGMSQWGAKALAEQGTDYAAILAHYYPGTTLCG